MIEINLNLNANSVGADTPSTGIISGGVLSINADPTKLDITAGVGYITNHTTFPATVSLIEWDATTVSITNLATTPSTDIAIRPNGTVIQQSSFTREELRNYILLGGVDHRGNTEIRNIFPIQIPSYGAAVSVMDLARAIGDINITGNVFSPNGANLKINKSAGSTFSFGRNAVNNPKDPHNTTQSSLTEASFSYAFDNGSGVASFLSETTNINPNIYDNGTGSTSSVPTNDYTYQQILFFPNSNNVFIQLGKDVWNTRKEAIAGLASARFTSLAGLRTAVVRGYIIIKQGTTDLTNTNNAIFLEADRQGQAVGAGQAVEWGNIFGTLSNQTDLQTALDAKINATEKAAANGVATLDGGGKVPANQLPSSVMQYKGQWNASTNTPTLANGVGSAGDVYEVSVAGTTNFGAGAITFKVGDWAVYDGAIWQKSVNSNEVVSVNSYTGAVTLTKTDIGLGNVPNVDATNRANHTGTQDASTITGTKTAAFISDFTTSVNTLIAAIWSSVQTISAVWTFTRRTIHEVNDLGSVSGSVNWDLDFSFTNISNITGNVTLNLTNKPVTANRAATFMMRVINTSGSTYTITPAAGDFAMDGTSISIPSSSSKSFRITGMFDTISNRMAIVSVELTNN